MIEVTELVKRYGNHTAVDHLSFKVETGQIYGFLGPNGAGKTTTMNILTGYLCANEGTVVINGFDIFKQPEKAKSQIGYLPELPPLYLDMTVEEYLLFAAELKKLSKAGRKEEAERVMAKTGIADVRERMIKHLSKGYKQRVGLAQALLGSPQIIILDEPTVGLDPKQIIEIRDLIRDLGKEHTVILSSHILSEVSAVCDEIMIISKGKLIAKDTPENLSRILEGEVTLHVSVKGTKQAVEGVLKQLNGIDSYKIEERDLLKLEIETKEGVDIREELFYLLAEKKLPIMEMGIKSASLEDVFIELTSNDELAEKVQKAENQKEKAQDEQQEEQTAADTDEITPENEPVESKEAEE